MAAKQETGTDAVANWVNGNQRAAENAATQRAQDAAQAEAAARAAREAKKS